MSRTNPKHGRLNRPGEKFNFAGGSVPLHGRIAATSNLGLASCPCANIAAPTSTDIQQRIGHVLPGRNDACAREDVQSNQIVPLPMRNNGYCCSSGGPNLRRRDFLSTTAAAALLHAQTTSRPRVE